MKKDESHITESSLRIILTEFRGEIAQDIENGYRRLSDEISEVISDLTVHIDKRFNKVEADIASLKRDMSTVKKDIHRINQKVDAIGLANQSRDSQLTRHERWLYLVANKANLTLPI